MIVQKIWVCFFFVLSSVVHGSDNSSYDALHISEKDLYRNRMAQAAMTVCRLMDQDHRSVVHDYCGVTPFFEQWKRSTKACVPEVDNVQQKAIVVCSVIQGIGIPLEKSPAIKAVFMTWVEQARNLEIIEGAHAYRQRLSIEEIRESVEELL